MTTNSTVIKVLSIRCVSSWGPRSYKMNGFIHHETEEVYLNVNSTIGKFLITSYKLGFGRNNDV